MWESLLGWWHLSLGATVAALVCWRVLTSWSRDARRAQGSAEAKIEAATRVESCDPRPSSSAQTRTARRSATSCLRAPPRCVSDRTAAPRRPTPSNLTSSPPLHSPSPLPRAPLAAAGGAARDGAGRATGGERAGKRNAQGAARGGARRRKRARPLATPAAAHRRQVRAAWRGLPRQRLPGILVSRELRGQDHGDHGESRHGECVR
jgi:hypothetical protein